MVLKALALVLPFLFTTLFAQSRIDGPIDSNRVAILKGHVHPRVQAQYDQGPLPPSTPMHYITLHLKPSGNQQAALDRLLVEQQDPSSANYHHWLTPEQFADRFGLTGSDIGKIAAWLESEGMTVNDVARGRHWITFSGTAEQVGHAFHTEIRRYRVDSETHFANATEPSVPEALEAEVAGVRGLQDFRSKSQHIIPKPEFNATDGTHRIVPDDLATIYDIQQVYKIGIDGTGQKIAIAGRTDIDIADIRAFRKMFNLPAKDPQVMLFGPDPGNQADDLLEADLDVEWSGAVARNATVIYVNSNSVETSAQYAIDQNLAPVLSYSYSLCEQLAEEPGAVRSLAQQANAQGITWVAASGDSGAASCDLAGNLSQAAKGLGVSFPASIPEVTAVGGTEFKEDSGNYWSSENSANSASALTYIPEIAWNDTASRNELLGTGGGVSVLYPKPYWQTGPGVPHDNARDVPDVAFNAAPSHDGYRVYSGGALHTVGGTSVGAPVFAGVLALLNQKLGAALGNVNPGLYRAAQAAPGVFHDITTGDNIVPCVQSSPNCSSGTLGYSTGPAYDSVTGLGSIDVYNLLTEWNAGVESSTTLIATPSAIGLSDTVQLTATVTGAGGSAQPTGNVTFVANDSILGTVQLTQDRTASVSIAAILIASGNGTVSALYSGDAVYNGSAGSAMVTLNVPASGSFVVPSISPNPVTQSGTGWVYTIQLTEKAGVPTKLTGFTINRASENLSLFDSTSIPGHGTLSTTLVQATLTPPVTQIFGFSGVDANGKTWTQQISVPFVGPAGPVTAPSISLLSTPGSVLRDPSADPSCQWAQHLILQEQSGYWVGITKLIAGGIDMTSRVQAIFGTTRLAPFGQLQGTLCWTGITPPSTKVLQLTGMTETGESVSATVSSSLGSPAATAAVMSLTPTTITIPVTSSSPAGSASLNLNFGGGGTAWTISVTPNRTTGWLTASPLSGTGTTLVNLQASGAGLASGVYTARLTVQAVNGIPQFIEVPVTLVVGASSTTSIAAVNNTASGAVTFAPGMLMSVYGSNLAPSTALPPVVPLSLNLAGVSATVNGIAAPFYYVSAGLLNIQVPYETGAGAAILGVNNNGQVASFQFTVTPSAPGIFIDPANQAIAPSERGQRGQTLALYITGEGDVTPAAKTGITPDAGTVPLPRLPVTVTVGSMPAAVSFAGVPSWSVGVTQVNFTIPKNAPLGVQPVVVTVGGVASPAANLTVLP